MKILNLSLILVISILQMSAQKEFVIKYTNETITLDGILDEVIWQNAESASDFIQNYPTDTARSVAPTSIYMAYDEKHLYLAAICYSIGEKYVIPSLKRDFRAGGSDNLTLIFNPYNDGTNAFFFGTNPRGVKREGLIANGGNDYDTGFVTAWDNAWHCEANIYDVYWIAEMAIPFSSLRFNSQTDYWSFNSYRFDTQTDERSAWIRIPKNQNLTALAYAGKMRWEKPLNAHSSKISLIPYLTGGWQKDYEDFEDATTKFDLGGDVKIAVTSGLNLDLTVNPDFSQVEVDQQITDLDRFEIFLPERRQFFIENSDLFASFGFNNINPFFSRRIGVAQDTSTGSNIANRIYAGARLSGKLTENLRIGILNMQTANEQEQGLPGFNYAVASLQQKLMSRSNLSVIFVNKQATGDFDESVIHHYNRMAGIDFNFANEDNTIRSKIFYHHSFNQSDLPGNWAHGFEITSDLKKHELSWKHEYVGEGYDPQVGFVRRKDYFKINPEISYKFYPTDKFINEHSFELEYESIWQPGVRQTDEELSLRWSAQFPQFSRLSVALSKDYVYLFDAFDPTGTDSSPLPENTDYSYWNVRAGYNSDESKAFQYRLNPYLGQYFNGKRFGLGGSFSYRFQPFGSISLNYSINHFDMPHLEETKQTYLMGPSLDISFSKAIFLSTLIQYNSQFENTNINARFQWRFAPVSDFFLVYTDNYFSGNPADPADRFAFTIRNRSIVAKFSYWLNL